MFDLQPPRHISTLPAECGSLPLWVELIDPQINELAHPQRVQEGHEDQQAIARGIA
jgi:hypothetical protein